MAIFLEASAFRLESETLPRFLLPMLRTKSAYQIARLGLDIAAIPPMSNKTERVFSKAKLLMTGQRRNPKMDILEAT